MDRIIGFCERLFEKNKKAVFLLLLLISLMGGLAGLKYYRYTRDDARFCTTCHIMQESYKNWHKSRHRGVICQKCHRLSMLEQNRLLVSRVAVGNAPVRGQRHGRVEPWKSCKRCHLYEARQGSISLRSSYGHARHVFIQGIGCVGCHPARFHNFQPDEKACSSCHRDKLVHGLGMEGLSCLKCHSYGGESPMDSSGRCFGCHEEVKVNGPKAELACFQCHKPHKKIRLKSADCMLDCHGTEVRVGQHGLHIDRAGLKCLDCHKPHTWVVGKKRAKGLCNRCHSMKDPETFIY